MKLKLGSKKKNAVQIKKVYKFKKIIKDKRFVYYTHTLPMQQCKKINKNNKINKKKVF